MQSKKKWFYDARLYLILDAQVNSYTELIDILKRSVESGIKIVQLRDKKGSAREILGFAQRAKEIINDKALFIMNDRVDLALISNASGVHVGQEDIPIKDARLLLGAKKIIGVSCQTKSQVKTAELQGADYIGFGSVFKTDTKPDRFPMDLDLLKDVSRSCGIPLYAIGGIRRTNVVGIKDIGVDRVAVCRDICCSKDVSGAVKFFQKVLCG